MTNIKNDGCIFCKNSSKSNITDSSLSLDKQYEQEVLLLNKKWPNAKHIIYFQTGSNTFININEFKNNVESLLKKENVFLQN